MNQEIIELAREVWPGKVIETEQLQQELQRFHDLAIAAEHTRLLAGSGEPSKHEFQGANGVWYPFLNDAHYQNTVEDGRWPIRALYTADQMAAAVLRERERCLSHAQSIVDFYGDADAGIHPLQVRERECASQIVAAIRGMQ